jgi:hypothetical protein
LQSLPKLDDKLEMGDVSAAASSDIANDLQELSVVLQKLSSFHSDLKKLSSELRSSLDNNTLGSLKNVQKVNPKELFDYYFMITDSCL